jgi:hypothetical protein
MIFCFFGFFRNSQNYIYPFDLENAFVFSPIIRNENSSEDVSDLIHKKFQNCNITLYEYNKQQFIDKKNKLCIPQFNQFYQQSYRIFSFFYNIKMVLEKCKLEQYNDSDIIILSRIDIGLSINFDKVHKYSNEFDVIVGEKSGMGTDDKWFIFKYKHIDNFISLYDDYEKYLLDYYNKNNTLISTRPEDVFVFHFKNKKMTYINTNDVIKYEFKHVCSQYCGHNGIRTLE